MSNTWHTTSQITVMARPIKIKNHAPPSASGTNDGNLWCDFLATHGSIQIFSAVKRHTATESAHAILAIWELASAMLPLLSTILPPAEMSHCAATLLRRCW